MSELTYNPVPYFVCVSVCACVRMCMRAHTHVLTHTHIGDIAYFILLCSHRD